VLVFVVPLVPCGYVLVVPEAEGLDVPLAYTPVEPVEAVLVPEGAVEVFGEVGLPYPPVELVVVEVEEAAGALLEVLSDEVAVPPPRR
jgi:hypothetical protein